MVIIEIFDLLDFYPRPPRGGRPAASGFYKTTVDISIHALREEGDPVQRFLKAVDILISIHALREEGDGHSDKNHQSDRNFYPRPPRGGRHIAEMVCFREATFLSTPSARRATRTPQPWED